MVVLAEDAHFWNLISDVPRVSKPVAVIQAVLNLLFPGLGTLVAACGTSNQNVSKT